MAMNTAHLHDCTPATQTALRLLACLLMASLLGGCQSMQESRWLPDLWPWQNDNEPAPDPALPAKQQQAASLVAKGDLALTKDRLTVPANDNALLHYRQALALDPDNAQAQAGIKRVAKRYRKLARVAHDNGNSKQALKYLHQSENIVGVSHPANRKLHRELEDTAAGQNQRSLEHSLRKQYENEKGQREQAQGLP